VDWFDRPVPAGKILTCFSFAQEPLSPTHVDTFTGSPRVIIMSDIGNEPDDQMSFVRLLLTE
jgi:hypothetical protein